MPLARHLTRAAVVTGATVLTLAVAVSGANALPAPCTLAVKSGSTTGYRDGLFSGACVHPSATTNVTWVAAGHRTGQAEFSLFEGRDCGGRIVARGLGEAFYEPPINFASVRIDHCP